MGLTKNGRRKGDLDKISMNNNMTKEETDKGLTGIRGWLLLFILCLFVEALVWSIWSIFSSGVYLADIFNIGLSILNVGLIILALKHKKIFPLIAIIVMWICPVLSISMTLLTGEAYTNVIQFGFPAIWTIYLLNSQRVKNTFVL